MSMREAWERIVSFAQASARKGVPLSGDIVEKIAELYEEYLKEAEREFPESLDHFVGYISATGSKLYRKRDIPRILREDREFAEKFIAMLAGTGG